MGSYDALNGETRVIPIIGDPIAQVKSPAGVTQALLAKGCNGIVVPIHVSPNDLDGFLRGASLAKNLDGVIVTVPHKFAAYRHCATASARAHFLGAVNTMRRNADGSWHGDMFDGAGFVEAICDAGAEPAEQPALLVGAGGAGSAIALALLEAGVSVLAVHDGDMQRRQALVTRLQSRFGSRVREGTADPTGFRVVVNATPAGMRAGDALPVDVSRLTPQMFVGDVITLPAVTPLVEAARARGCKTQVGGGMFLAVRALMVEFLLGATPVGAPR